jgi:putative ATPase
MKDVRSGATTEVPMHLRDASYRGAKRIGHGKGYKYPHDYPDAWIDQSYLPEEVRGRRYYEPTERGLERDIGERLDRRRSKSNPDSSD